jgi:hypothetical protein
MAGIGVEFRIEVRRGCQFLIRQVIESVCKESLACAVNE